MLMIGRLLWHGLHTGARTFFLFLPLVVLPPSLWTDLLGFSLTSWQKHTAYLIYCAQRNQILFFNTGSYLLPSVDLQILYQVPHSYSLFRDSSSCVGQMAQSVGCIRALKKRTSFSLLLPRLFWIQWDARAITQSFNDNSEHGVGGGVVSFESQKIHRKAGIRKET